MYGTRRIVYNYLGLHALMPDAAIFMAYNFVYTGLLKFHGGFIDIPVDSHHVYIFFRNIKSMDDIFGSDEKINFTSNGYYYLRWLKLPHLGDRINLISFLIQLLNLRLQIGFIEGQAFGKVIISSPGIKDGKYEKGEYGSGYEENLLF